MFKRVFVTSLALSETGKTLSPLSTFVFSPFLLSISRRRVLSKVYNALYKNSLFLTIWSKNSDISLLFVTLHLPLPVM